MVAESFIIEDVLINEKNSNRSFAKTSPIQNTDFFTQFCNPTLGNFTSKDSFE